MTYGGTKRGILFKLSIFVMAAIALLICYIVAISLSDKIYKGISIQGVDVSNCDVNQAYKKLKEQLDEELMDKRITISIDGYLHTASLYDLGVNYDYYQTVMGAYRIGRSGSVFKKISQQISLRFKPRDLEIGIIYNNRTEELINQLSSKVIIQPKDATIKLQGSSFIIQPEVLGKKLDKQQAKEAINRAIKVKALAIYMNRVDYHPKVTKAELEKIKEPLAGFSTQFNMGDENRVHNITLAAKSIDGALIMPGDTFSFNQNTGLRTKAMGYLEAPVVMGGDYTLDVGGGVCQVSSTLYNAVLYGGLEIVERRNHSLPPGYIEKGRDATVTDNYIDFKFKNNSKIPIYLKSMVSGNVVHITLYSQKNQDYEVKIETIIFEEVDFPTKELEDPSLPQGMIKEQKPGKKGYKVDSYRIYKYKDGTEKREYLSRDSYKPMERIVIKGTRKN